MSIDPVIFGQRLRHYRRHRGLTLEQLGAQIGRPAPFLSLVENGKREPRLSELDRFADALGVGLPDLLDPEPPNRRAALEVGLERAQHHPRYRELRLPHLKPSAKLPDTAIEHVLALFEELLERDREAAQDDEEIRRANGVVTERLRRADGYLADVETAAAGILEVAGYDGPGPLTSRHINDIVASLGYRIRSVDDIPPGTRSIVDPESRAIYVAQRNELRTRQARKAILQTVGAMVLGHTVTDNAVDFLWQRLESAYFAAAVLVPEASAVPYLLQASTDRDLSVEDVKEQFYVSYEMAAQRFTNLSTRHLGMPSHFVRNEQDGTIWKAYANDGVPLPTDPHGGSEGQRVCRLWGARAAFSADDRFAIHHQFTDTPAGSFWCSTHLAADGSGHAYTVGVRFVDARVFRGRRTNSHTRSQCPHGACCETTSALDAVSLRSQQRLVSLLQTRLVTTEAPAVAEFLDRHADDADPGEWHEEP